MSSSNNYSNNTSGRLSKAGQGRLQLFPIWKVIKNYSWDKLKADARAAANVSMMDFPQGMAYALLAGLPIQFGVYCSGIASVVGPLFASSRFVMFGPTTATSILVLSTFLALKASPEEVLVGLPLLVILVGLFLVCGAFLRLGSLARYISRSVTSAYVTAVALLTLMNQASVILGFNVKRASTFWGMLKTTLVHLYKLHLPTCLVSILTFMIYMQLQKRFRQIPHIGLTLIVMTVVVWVMNQFGLGIQTLTSVPTEGWIWAWPRFDFEWMRQLMQPALALALLVLLDNANIAKNLAAHAGDKVDLNQQMLSLGIANMTSSIGSGMVVSASVIRSQLNFNSGARSCISSMLSGFIVISGVLILGPYFKYVPKASLSMLMMIVASSLIRMDTIRMIIRSTRSDGVVFFFTLIVGLMFHLESAIYVGAALSIVFFLKKVSVPQLIEYDFDEQGTIFQRPENKVMNTPEISIVHVEGDLFFGSTDIFLDQIRMIVQDPNLKIIILRLRNAHHLDATSAMAIQELVLFARNKGRDLIVSGILPEVAAVFRNSGLMKVLGEDNCFMHSNHNPNHSTREALKRAQSIIGQKTSKIKLFVAPKEDEPKG